MNPTKSEILALLAAFIRQRPGMEFANYGDVAAYRSELRGITKDFGIARQLMRAVELSSIDAESLMEAFKGAYSGRLSIEPGKKPGTWQISYCAGQYFPTEYRRAACAVLASALWAHKRDHCMPAPIAHKVIAYGSGPLTSKPVGIHTACEIVEANGGKEKCYIDNVFRDGNGRANLSAGDWLRSSFRRDFGRGIQSRFFN